MATRTISNSGGTRAFSDSASWVEGAAPTSADDVVATATSGSLTITSNAACQSIDLIGHVGTFTLNPGVTLTVGGSAAGPGNRAIRFPATGGSFVFVNTSSGIIN